jgi:hypothetical protein
VDRIEVEATGPVAALDAAKRLLPESAESVGYRVIAEVPLPGSPPRPQPRTTLKGCLGSDVLAIFKMSQARF